MTIEQGTLLKCCDCSNEFRWIAQSTIKPVRCMRCQNMKDFQKRSDKRKEENKKILERASFYDKSESKHPKTIKHTPNKQSVFKSLKNGKSEHFDKTRIKSKSATMSWADSMFSRFIRLKHSFIASGEVVCKCYTCGRIKSIKNIECGHWQRRGFKTTRYNEDNARPQCTQCNLFKSGEPEKFEINLIKEIGQTKVDELKKLSQQIGEDNTRFYNEMAGLYKYKLDKYCKEKGINSPWKKVSK